ncbi:hypothetical protein HAX54_012186, partial [Datura stramonium]|nr:hypothetical protein [Datura stramonium]
MGLTPLPVLCKMLCLAPPLLNHYLWGKEQLSLSCIELDLDLHKLAWMIPAARRGAGCTYFPMRRGTP